MKNIIWSIFGIAFIGFFIYGIIQLFVWLFHSDIKIIAGFFAFFSAISGAFITQYYIKKREERNAHRDKKIEIYSEFIDIAQRMLAGNNDNVDMEEVDSKELQDFFFRFNRDILLWGSPGVIKSLLEFRKASSSVDNKQVLFVINDLYKEFRKDIGLSNFGLNSNELLKVNLSDPEELDKL